MRNPLAAWRAGTRWPLAALGAVAALVVAVLVCEAIGWPFLVSPVQHWLSRTLDRRVAFNDEAGGQSGVRVRLLGGVRVTAERIEIGAPDWSKAPHMLLAREARLRLGYVDLWRAWRGAPLRIKDLQARELDGALERLADGRASWQFGKKKATDDAEKPGALPTFDNLRVGKGHLTLHRRSDAGLDRGPLRPQRRQRPGRRRAAGEQRLRPRRHLRPRRRRGEGRLGCGRGRGARARRARAAPECLRPVPQAAGADRAAHGRRPRPARSGQRGDGAAAAPDRQRRPRQPVVRRHDHRSAAFRRPARQLRRLGRVAGRDRRSARHHPADDAGVQDPRHPDQGRRPVEGGLRRGDDRQQPPRRRLHLREPAQGAAAVRPPDRLAPGAGRPRAGRRHLGEGGPGAADAKSGSARARHSRPQVRPALAAGDGRQRPVRHRHVRPGHDPDRAAAAGARPPAARRRRADARRLRRPHGPGPAASATCSSTVAASRPCGPPTCAPSASTWRAGCA